MNIMLSTYATMIKHERSVRVGIKLQIHLEICQMPSRGTKLDCTNFVGQNNVVLKI